ncbi:MAG: CoA transferase, partial [Burkholderiaceae bacterium]
RDALIPILEAHFATRSAAECLDALVAADIPAGPINNIAQVFDDPQVVSRRLCTPVSDQANPPLNVIANPIRYINEPIARYERPPSLGEHTHEILGKLLSYPEQKLNELAESGVIGPRPMPAHPPTND